MTAILRITLATLLVILCSSQTSLWSTWNTLAMNGNIANPYYTSLAYWGLTNFYRLKNIPNVDLKNRYNQYTYAYTGSYPCKVACAPRSFLVKINGLLLCQRDDSPNFWGSVNDASSFCVPDFPFVPSKGICVPVLGSPSLKSTNCVEGQIDSAYTSAGYNRCCFNDARSEDVFLRKNFSNSTEVQYLINQEP